MTEPAEPEQALETLLDIAAHLEVLWRQRLHRRRGVTERAVRWWIEHRGLPAVRFARGRWEASPAEVTAWWERNFSTSNVGNVGNVEDVG